MRELGSHSHSAMSSSGKGASSSSCLSSQCFDLLTRSCVKCSDLFKDNTKPSHTAPTSALAPTLPSVDLPRTLLIFGVPAVVGFILTLAALWGFLACKVGKWRRKRKAVDKEAEENMDITSPLPSLGCQDPVVLEGDATLTPVPCPHLNGGLKMPGPPGKAGAKRRPCCRGDADGDIVLLSTVYTQHDERNHGFPLPATELGSTALVTTKTTQNCAGEERA
ncbi:tumor necrosis factor receptor superfamily member 13C isoform X2 [Falco biarmicus]|uniref:tumor necrosis factor receptor superfamily member 13C isoform X2 n=1 Tax=Falco cherrug TaxID=345164 RepID=UPI00247A3329|nr:tumor necrosis factor receptor superfamily member 13C isoform X2 [Falco cherrug]XP_055664993.1 tumor necrosis factor receptor superfamily member 13C isoform X2 [Falco peregrinus]XP_056197599.1 tumor necrosis factor receptor superfamily member 13C isoform X2 [Falco biarmicus]